MGNPITSVKRPNGIATEITVEHEGKKYVFIPKNNQPVCISKERMPKNVFMKFKNQLRAIFGINKILPKNRITLYSKSQKEKNRLIALHEFFSYPLDDGTITIFRNYNVPQNYPDIHSAIRAQEHILKNYFGNEESMGELDKLHEIHGISDEVHKMFMDWNRSTDEQRMILKEKLITIHEDLSQCHNRYKVEVKEQIKKIAKMKDSLGRNNPGAMATRANCAKNKNEKRQEQIPPKAKRVALRRHVLIMEEKQMKANITFAAFKLSVLLKSFDKLVDNPETIDKIINQTFHLLQSIWTEPYKGKIIKPLEFLYKSKDCIETKNYACTKSYIFGAKDLLKEILI